MASLKNVSRVASGAAIAAALAGAMPAAALEVPAELIGTLPTGEAEVEALAPESTLVLDIDQDLAASLEFNETAPAIAADIEFAPVATEVTPEEVFLADASTPDKGDETVATTADTLQSGELALGEGVEVAQASRPLFRGAPPFYLGLGGNIGFVNGGNSASGQFAFAGISKISLGPRFALRPALFLSSTRTTLTAPITYNFDPLQAGGFTVYPFVGGGIDIPFGSSAGLLINGGIDVPFSQQFTFNATANVRASSGFGLGLLLGIGYNFPIFFD